MTTATQRHRILAGPTRDRLLQVLREAGRPLGVRDLADRVALHPNSVREQLTVLVKAGLVAAERTSAVGRGRPALLYRTAESAEGPDGDAYLALARALVDQVAAAPAPAEAAVAVGERWGSHLWSTTAPEAGSDSDPVAGLVGVLASVGFRPERPEEAVRPGRPQGPHGPLGPQQPAGTAGTPPSRTRASSIRLRRCPFVDLARESADVVCGIHLGLMRGVLRASHAPVGVLSIQPFAEPGICLAHLGASPRD